MTVSAHPLARHELIRATTIFSGWATSDGNVGGTTIVDSKLIGVNDFVTGRGVLIMNGSRKWEFQLASSFSNITGTITVSSAYSGQITSGTLYRILTLSPNALALAAALTALQADVGDASASALGSLYAILGNPATALATRIGNPDAHTLVSLVAKLGNLARDVDTILGSRWDASGDLGTDIAGLLTLTATKVAGRTQIHTKQITSAANAGDVTVATATTQPVLVRSLAVRSNGATTADLTSAAVYAATSKRVTLIDPVEGAQANLDAAGKQVVFPVASGPVYLAVGETIVITLAGTGATPVDLQVITECVSVVDGGYLA